METEGEIETGAVEADEPYLGVDEIPSVVETRKLVPAEVKLGAEEVTAVSMIAKSMGLTGGSFEDMCQTWLRPITDEGWGTTAAGITRAKAVVHLLGRILDGAGPTKALKEVGLSHMELAALRHASPEFGKVYREAIAVRKERIGDDVLDTAFEMATKGQRITVRDRNGNVVGEDVVRNERMLDRLLSLSGPEFMKGSAAVQLGMTGGVGSGGPAVVMNFHFDRKGIDEKGKSEGGKVIDV